MCLSTGTGKSKVAIDFIKDERSIKEILITSPRTNLKENWRKELEKWNIKLWGDDRWIIEGQEGRQVKIIIENVQTAYKWDGKQFDLIIADEIHTMMTPEYSKVFELNTEYLIGLTATHDITSKNDKYHYYKKYCPVIYEYYDSADDGLINKTRFFIVNHRLSNTHKVLAGTKNNRFYKGELDHYDFLTERIKAGQRLMMAQGSDDWFTDAANWFWKGLGDRDQKNAAMRYLNAIKYRKDFLLNLTSAAAIARNIVNGILRDISDSKVLIFSELTNQIESITPATVHSHNKEEINQLRIDHFNEGKLRMLGSCQSLTLGLNLKGATHGIMESYVGSATRSKQKKGRLDRLAANDVADMWFIRILDTQSDKWFEQMTKGFDLSDAQHIKSSIILSDNYDYKTSNVKFDS